MVFEILVERLRKEEVRYELRCRGLPCEGLADDLRRSLRLAMQSGTNNPPEIYPFTFQEDYDAVLKRYEEVEALIVGCTDGVRKEVASRIETKTAHAIGRLSNSKPIGDEELELKEELLCRWSLLRTKYELLVRPVSRTLLGEREEDRDDEADATREVTSMQGSSVPMQVRSTGSRLMDDAGADMRSAEVQPAGHASQLDAVGATTVSKLVSCKSMPVSKWNVHFAGDAKGLSLSGFIERIDELMVARNVDSSQVFAQACDLFTGKALIWYRANRSLVGSWKELIELLRQEFQPIDYDERLLEEIKRRTQGADETMGIYLAVMKTLFDRMSEKMSEQRQLRIILRNISPFYQTQLGLTDIQTIEDLRRYGRKIEERRYAIDSYVPPTRKKGDLEVDVAYVGRCDNEVEMERCVMVDSGKTASPNQGRVWKCWNCGDPSHRAGRCTRPQTHKYCYRCGCRDVTVVTCPKCNGGQGNGSGRQRRAEH